MTPLLPVLAIVPLVATLVCLVVRTRVLPWVTLASGAVALAATTLLVPAAADHVLSVGFLRVDSLSEVFLLPTGFLYAGTAAYSIGHIRGQHGEAGGPTADTARYQRMLYVGLNGFAWSMLCAPLADGLALLWIAIEITTVISALLVALDNTEGATEAAWKYVLIASCGLGIGLLATIVMYYAGSQELGSSYDLAFEPLIAHAAQLPDAPVRLAFVLAVVGFGTKVGLFPVHTWLPDAHAEAPTPVSALLSGSLLAVSFYAILRYYQVAHVTLGEDFVRGVLLLFGVASLALAALSMLEQTNLKRLLAYSSVEHMGILAIGVGFGTRLALIGVFLHVLVHAAAKGNAFLGAGTIVHAFDTKELTGLRDVLTRLPWTGPAFFASIFALCALPPFGMFRSEFLIVVGGIDIGHHVPAAILLLLVTVAFLGLTRATVQMMMPATDELTDQPTVLAATATPRAGRPSPFDEAWTWADQHIAVQRAQASKERGPRLDGQDRADNAPEGPVAWTVAPLFVGLAVLVWLGVHPPQELSDLLSTAARQLQGLSR
ncbi:MAG: proton-conducting transporter membrane subunit [Nocardioides sp.]